MNTIDNTQMAQAMRLLQEMQSMAGQASGSVRPQEGEQAGFADAMRQAVEQVNSLQNASAARTDAFLRGEDVDLTEVMVSMQKSRVAFEATKTVRNHLVDAYRDIFNMPV